MLTRRGWETAQEPRATGECVLTINMAYLKKKKIQEGTHLKVEIFLNSASFLFFEHAKNSSVLDGCYATCVTGNTEHICCVSSYGWPAPMLLSDSSRPWTESPGRSSFLTLGSNAVFNDKLMKSCFFLLGQWSFNNVVGVRPKVLFCFASRMRTT